MCAFVRKDTFDGTAIHVSFVLFCFVLFCFVLFFYENMITTGAKFIPINCCNVEKTFKTPL